jgi:hypothetical protein
MAEVKAKKCTICNATVNTLSSYAQLSLGKLAHLQCVRDEEYDKGYAQGQIDLRSEQDAKKSKDEQEAKQRAARERLDAEVVIRNYANDLPRCPGCGRRVNEASRYQNAKPIEQILALGIEVVEPSEGPLARRGVCQNCVETERVARNEARRPQAAAAAQPKAAEDKKPDEKKDRFELLEIE